MTQPHAQGAAALAVADRALQWSIAVLVVAQASVVGLQVVARHVLRQPFPWTEEVARLLLVWLMCIGGISALRHGQHPRVTALVRLLSESRPGGRRAWRAAGAARVPDLARRAGVAADRRQRRRAPARQRPVGRDHFRGAAAGAPADGSGAGPAGPSRWRVAVARPRIARLVARRCRARARLGVRAAGGRRGAAPRAGQRFPRHRGAGRAARLHAGAHVADLPAGDWRRRPDHPADQDPRRRGLVRAPRHPALHPRRGADGVGRHLGADRRSRDGDRRAGARWAGDGGGRGRDPLLGHLGIHRGRRVGDQLAAGAVDAQVRLLGRRGGQRRRGGVGDGHPGAAVPDDGGARVAGQPVDCDPLPRRLRAGIPARGGAARS